MHLEPSVPSTVHEVFASYCSSCTTPSGSFSPEEIIKASERVCKLAWQRHKRPTYQLSISISHRSDTRSHTGSSEVNPRGPFYHAEGATKWNKRWSFKASEKICELFQVAFRGFAELYIRAQAGVINRTTMLAAWDGLHRDAPLLQCTRWVERLAGKSFQSCLNPRVGGWLMTADANAFH